jgi:hypothetical protein
MGGAILVRHRGLGHGDGGKSGARGEHGVEVHRYLGSPPASQILGDRA